MTTNEVHKELGEYYGSLLPKGIKKDWGSLTPHIVNVLTEEGKQSDGFGKDFYHKLMEPVRKYNEVKRGWKSDSPQHTLFNAILALTSGAQTPKNNFVVADRMWDEGEKRRGGGLGHVIRYIPHSNQSDFDTWVESLHPIDAPLEGHTPKSVADSIELWENHLFGTHAISNPAYAGLPAKHTKDGKIAQYELSGKVHHVFKTRKPLSNTTIPQIGEDGRVVPKGWTVRGENVRSHLADLQLLERHFDGNPRQMANWLLLPHNDEEFQNIFGKKPARPFHNPGEEVPGFMILGPKFGSFGLNLSGDFSPTTQDMWVARMMHQVGKGKTKISKSDESPANDTERKHWHNILSQVGQNLGLSNADTQALLWYVWKRKYSARGAGKDESSYADGPKARILRDAEMQKQILKRNALRKKIFGV